MTGMLSTGSSALLAFQRALGTISHNVANATTDGYSRQRVELAARAGTPLQGGAYIGQGVDVAKLQRLADGLVFARQVDSSGEVGRLTSLSSMATRVDALLSDSTTGLSVPFSDFFKAARGVSADPTSTTARTALLAAAQSLATRWNSLDTQLSTIEDETDASLLGKVNDANQLAREIADLNRSIAAAGGSVTPDMLDARETRINKLAAMTGATITKSDDGSMNVFTLGGQPLVLGAKANPLSTIQDPFRPDRLQLAIDTGHGTPTRLADSGLSGELGGLLEFRSRVLDPARNELGRLATVMATTFNEAQRAGVDYNGNPGTDLFALQPPTVQQNAANTGTASFVGSIGNASALTGNDVVMRFDGSAWSAQRADNGLPVAMTGSGTAADPFVVDGVSLVMSGSAAAGDRFSLRPTSGAAGSLRVAISDPAHIAAAGPMVASADTGNLGNGRVATTTVTNAAAFAAFTGASIEFIDDTQYTVNGAGPFAWTPGSAIADPGGAWSITLSGTPGAGDSFALGRTPARSSGNANAQAFSTLDTRGVLNGGSVSLTVGLSELVSKAGTEARHADLSLEAQQAIDLQVGAERESISGVNLEEEATNLMKYQQAYQAAAQILKTADTMFQTLLATVSR
ncbi:flagellar hook-associated protein FlgK [Luteimonas sp. RIT-PG2_3]